MIQKFTALLQNNAWADMATGKMAAGAQAMRTNSMLADAESVVSPINLHITWFSYGFAAALVLMSCYFFFMVRRQTDVSDKKRSLIIGAALFGLALLLWILPARIFPNPIMPQNFDMRTT